MNDPFFHPTYQSHILFSADVFAECNEMLNNSEGSFRDSFGSSKSPFFTLDGTHMVTDEQLISLAPIQNTVIR